MYFACITGLDILFPGKTAPYCFFCSIECVMGQNYAQALTSTTLLHELGMLHTPAASSQLYAIVCFQLRHLNTPLKDRGYSNNTLINVMSPLTRHHIISITCYQWRHN